MIMIDGFVKCDCGALMHNDTEPITCPACGEETYVRNE